MQQTLSRYLVDRVKNEPVQLNIGGTHMTVGRYTLTKVKESKLSEMFSDITTTGNKNEGDRVFLDRNPLIFKYIIDYL